MVHFILIHICVRASNVAKNCMPPPPIPPRHPRQTLAAKCQTLALRCLSQKPVKFCKFIRNLQVGWNDALSRRNMRKLSRVTTKQSDKGAQRRLRSAWVSPSLIT